MIFFPIDLCATLPSLLLQPEVSICMSDKLKALAIDLDGTLRAGESLSERNPRVVAAAYKKGYHVVVAIARRLQPGFVEKLCRICNENGCIAGVGRASAYRHGSGQQHQRRTYHSPTLSMESQGSSGARESPFCRISIEMLSGDLTKAMRPSRGGLLITTPPSIKR